MFLKVLKEKLNQKNINKLIANRVISSNDNKIRSVGVLYNVVEFNDFNTLALDINETKYEMLVFTEDENLKEQQTIDYFSPKDFSWNTTFKNEKLNNFANIPFDMLICYYKKDIPELNLVTAASKANFKVGLSHHDERLYDLIIDVNPSEIEIFKTELKKYLTLLNKI